MKRKKILFCDDNDDRFMTLKTALETRGYQALRSTHWRSVMPDLEANPGVQLLLLDLGFPTDVGRDIQWVGHKCLPDVVARFPEIKVIILSDILNKPQDRDEALGILEKLVQIKQVHVFLKSTVEIEALLFHVDRLLGTSSWLTKSGEETWLLHVSVTHFKSDEKPKRSDVLANEVERALQRFVAASKPDNEHLYPGISVVNGDLTHEGRPDQFEAVESFCEAIASAAQRECSTVRGLGDLKNMVIVPGNHDLNWDIMRGMNICVEEGKAADKKLLYKSGMINARKELSFLKEYSWLPFEGLNVTAPGASKDWARNKGYCIVDYVQELHLCFACLNSSKWGVTHEEKIASVPENILLAIKKDFLRIDPQHIATRILVVHHTLSDRAKPDEMLVLREDPENKARLEDLIARDCCFSILMTGHRHEMIAHPLTTKAGGVIHIGAGTALGGATRQHTGPGFNVLKLHNLSPSTGRYEKLSVYAFAWDGTSFNPQAAFGVNGDQFHEEFKLIN